MNFIQFWHQKGNFSTSNLRFAYFARSKMPFKGIIMFLVMNITKLERKILIILDFENGFLPTYLPLWNAKETFAMFDDFDQTTTFITFFQNKRLQLSIGTVQFQCQQR